MSGASHRLEQSSRPYNYGFDVSKLDEREEKGRKDWRAEVVPTDDEKDRAKAAVVSFKAEFPLGGGTLDAIFASHQAHVSHLLQHGPRHQRAWYAQRLEMARVAHERLASIPIIHDADYAFSDGLCDFVSYVHGKPHGTRERMPALKVQAKPYGLGRVRGCVLASRVCLAPCPLSCPHRAGPFPTQVPAS